MLNSDETQSSDEEQVWRPIGRRTGYYTLLNHISTMINNASSRLTDRPTSRRARTTEDSSGPTTFDTSLAARHEYLGSDLEELRGRTLHDEGSIFWIPILLELGVVLVPGQTLPLTVFYPPTISMLKDIITKDKTFGVVCVKNGPQQKQSLAQFGTTAEIFQYQEEGELAGFKVKAKGQQRFKLLDQKRLMPGILSGKVVILPEVTLPNPLQLVRLNSLDHHRRNAKLKKRIAKKDASSTPWPHWVFMQYDPECLVERVSQELRRLKLDVSQASLPSDPLDLSYWVAQWLPIEDLHRVGMLSLDTAVERLQYALALLAKCQKLFCHTCRSLVGYRKDLFSMSVEGPQGTYCNPGGHVHEIVTLHHAMGLSLSEEDPSTEYSWFPGYGWTIASCAHCDRHMGWLFTAMSEELRPLNFWGLSRRSVTTLSGDASEDGADPDDAMSV